MLPSATSRALIFDLDGTLIDSATDLAQALNILLAERHRPALRLAQVKGFVGDGALKLVERAFAATGGPDAVDTLPALTQRFIAIYESIPATSAQLYPDVAAVLAGLRQTGLRLGLCTNKPQSATEKLLPQLGLGNLFDAVVGGDALPVRKPEPAHLQAVIDRLGIANDRAIMIGDNDNDAAVARGCGVPFIAMLYGYPRVPVAELGAAALLKRFVELPGAINCIWGESIA